MKKIFLGIITLVSCVQLLAAKNRQDVFPDGTPVPAWFSDTVKLKPEASGKLFVITDFGVLADSTLVQTQALQNVIDKAAAQGGGVIVIPKGTFLSGALFFKPTTKLHLVEGAVLKGSDDIADYPKIPSRVEGQNLDYFAALINAYGVNGFSVSGNGTIDGNGAKYWDAFWQRRKENPKCTNLEVSRPRLLFIWNCNDVQVQDVTLRNSGFWSSHYYQCRNVKVLNVTITSPHEVQRAPSTDAIDLDVCTNVLIKGCYLSVNDDAIALKGGKGPWADKDPGNGGNANIIIEDCTFGFCHAALTLGSEAIHNRNVLMRRCKIDNAKRVLWLKMRPDTPQEYEFVTVQDIEGNAYSLIYVKPWTQFFDLKGRKDVPLSTSKNITLKNIKLKCDVFFDVKPGEHDRLSGFHFENLDIKAKNAAFDKTVVSDFTVKNVTVNGQVLN